MGACSTVVVDVRTGFSRSRSRSRSLSDEDVAVGFVKCVGPPGNRRPGFRRGQDLPSVVGQRRQGKCLRMPSPPDVRVLTRLRVEGYLGRVGSC